MRSSSYIGPNWRSIDLSLSNLICSTAGLLVVESVPLSLSSAEASLSMRHRGCEEDEERKTVVWQLLADPGEWIYAYYTCLMMFIDSVLSPNVNV